VRDFDNVIRLTLTLPVGRSV